MIALPSPFVVAKDTQFTLNDLPFPVFGVNCYFLAYCSDESRRAAMTTAKQMGANTIRAWAFLDVHDFAPGRVAFQHGQDDNIVINDGPDGLHRLDALIKAAEDLDIKLILPLTNHWEALGGMPAYVKWLSPGSDVTEFYRAPAMRSAYQSWVRTLLTRTNTITGRLYSEEPAIMAWELTNEARCPVPGGRELLVDWISEMSAFVKRHDSNHLLALGDEGFFYKKGSGHLYDGTYGVDWETNLALENMDFGTYHFYPQDWGYGKRLGFAKRWIGDHSAAAARLNKPAILEEYGLRLDKKGVKTPEDRKRIFQQWMGLARDSGTAGCLMWMLGQESADNHAYRDDFVIYEAGDAPAIET